MNNNELNIKDLILSDPAEETSKEKKAKTTKPLVKYEQVIGSGCDFAIRRKTARTSKLLVCLMSQEQYYISDENAKTIERATATNLRKFFSDYNGNANNSEFPIKDVVWIKSMPTGKRELEDFINYINKNREVLQPGLMFYSSSYCSRYDYPNFQSLNISEKETYKLLTKELLKLGYSIEDATTAFSERNYYNRLKTSYDNQKMGILYYNLSLLDAIKEKFGLNNIRNFIVEYMNLTFPIHLYHYRSDLKRLFDLTEFKYANFKDYVLYESVRQGYSDSVLSEWYDTLKMQIDVYGKIKDKYPENLSSEHQKLSFKSAILKEEIDEAKWNKAYAKNSKLEWKDSEWIIYVPEKRSDLIDEAQQQSNCVASYFDRIINGTSKICCLRSAEEPEKSVVTIEVSKDNVVVQVKARNNTNPSRKHNKIIAKWAKDKDLICNYYGM